MKKSRTKKSLVVSSALYFVIYTVIVLLIYMLFSYQASRKMFESYTMMEDILVYEDEFQKEYYEKIPMENAHNSAYLVFDLNGNIRYASNQNIGKQIFFEDLEWLDEYNTGRNYDVFEERDPITGEVRYRVCLSEYGDETEPARLIDYAYLDEEFKILRGELFGDRTYLSQREFDLLNGVLSKDSIVEKYTYETVKGEGRILVFWFQRLSDEEYSEIIESSYVTLAMGVPVIILVVIVFALLFSRRIKKYIEPLNSIIRSYEDGKSEEINEKCVPREFSRTVEAFRNLIHQVENDKEEKEKLYEGKQKLIADISHDIKTPLTVIQGYAKALTDHMVPKEKEEQYLEAIYRKSELATGMVNDLFLMTKMERPDYTLQKVEIDFFEFTKELFAERYMEIAENGFDVLVDIPNEMCMLAVDVKLMERCYQNLLGNALKYNPKGTTLFLQISQTEEMCQVIVADNGIGIPNEIAGSIFEPFVTGNKARTTGKGTGLGLSIVQKIIDMHGGTIELVLPPEDPYKTEFKIRLWKNTEM